LAAFLRAIWHVFAFFCVPIGNIRFGILASRLFAGCQKVRQCLPYFLKTGGGLPVFVMLAMAALPPFLVPFIPAFFRCFFLLFKKNNEQNAAPFRRLFFSPPKRAISV
jgi:hypothetical protein